MLGHYRPEGTARACLVAQNCWCQPRKAHWRRNCQDWCHSLEADKSTDIRSDLYTAQDLSHGHFRPTSKRKGTTDGATRYSAAMLVTASSLSAQALPST